MNKQTLRIWAKEKRTELDMERLSSILADKLVQTKEYKKSKNIMLYYPIKNEVDLLSILKDNSKKFYLPRIKGEELECCPYCIGEKLMESCFHTQEPTCKACNKSDIDLVIVPALACDVNNYRLGYGGGYYDRFLKNFNGKSISCIPPELLVNNTYPNEHDIKLDLIITA